MILNGDELSAGAAFWVFSYMIFPDDPVTAKRIAHATYEDFADNSSFSPVSDLGKRTFLSKLNHGRLCGTIALQVVRNHQNTGNPDLLKAQYAVSELAHSLETNDGKTVPSDFRNLKKSFKFFKSVLHLWAAQEVMLIARDYEGTRGTLPAILSCEKEMPVFLKVAAWFELQLTPLLHNWHPLQIPDVFKMPVIQGELSVHLPPNTPEMEGALATYQNKGPGN